MFRMRNKIIGKKSIFLRKLFELQNRIYSSKEYFK